MWEIGGSGMSKWKVEGVSNYQGHIYYAIIDDRGENITQSHDDSLLSEVVDAHNKEIDVLQGELNRIKRHFGVEVEE